MNSLRLLPVLLLVLFSSCGNIKELEMTGIRGFTVNQISTSGIDGDLLVDYAKKLTPKGVNAKLIPPYGNVKFYRLAVAEGDTYTSTQATADQLKSEYTEGAWVIRY